MNTKLTVFAKIGSSLLDVFMFQALFRIMKYALQIDGTNMLLSGILIILFITAYLNKDAFKGQSPAKRLLKIQVVDFNTGKIASPSRCLLRNLTFLIFIIEIPFMLINPQRRLGDQLAGTIIKPYDPNIIPDDVIESKPLHSIFISLIGVTVIFTIIALILFYFCFEYKI